MNRNLALFTLLALFAAGLSAACQRNDAKSDGPFANALGWDVRAIPSFGMPLREYKTPKGCLVQVMEEGVGEPAKPGTAKDISMAIYTLDGVRHVQALRKKLVTPTLEVRPGFNEGLAKMRKGERRRIFIPSELGYGKKGQGSVAPDSDLIVNVQWAAVAIEILKKGTGMSIQRGDTMVAHYRGSFEDGRVFDESYKRGEPLTRLLDYGSLIDGWVEGVIGMKVGGKRKLWIPWHLAYGEAGIRQKIPGRSNMIFEIELLDVKPGKKR